MEYDNDHSGGREELSAFLGCSTGVHSDWMCTAGPEAKESPQGPDPHSERKIAPPGPREQAVSLYLGDHSEDVCPLGRTHTLALWPAVRERQATNRAPERSK